MCPYRQLLFDALDGGLQCSGAPGGFVLYSLHGFQQRRHVGHHHLNTTGNKKNRKSSLFIHIKQHDYVAG